MAKERLSRSDKGALALVRAFMKEGMGLSQKTIGLVMKRIVDSGELANMKRHMRENLSGGTYSRINSAVDMAEEDASKRPTAKKEDNGEESKDEMSADEKKPEEKKEVKESKLTFMNHLLNEVGTAGGDTSVTMDVNPEDLRDPDKKREAMIAQRKTKTTPQKEKAIRLKIKELQDRLKAIRSGGDMGGM